MARGAQSGWTGLRADDRGARLASLLFDFRRILGLDTLAGRLKPETALRTALEANQPLLPRPACLVARQALRLRDGKLDH